MKRKSLKMDNIGENKSEKGQFRNGKSEKGQFW